MRILLDNCVPYRAKTLFPGHQVKHTADIGFEKLSNGQLLTSAANEFDVLVTTDKNIRHGHNLSQLPISVLELNTSLTRLADLQTLSSHLESALKLTADFRFVSVDALGRLERLGPRPR